MKRKSLFRLLVTQLVGFVFAVQCYALDTITHRQINEYLVARAMDVFSLDFYLKKHLGIEEGVKSQIRGGIDNRSSAHTVSEWFGLGGVTEDSAS